MPESPPPNWAMANAFAVPGTGHKPRGPNFRTPRHARASRLLLAYLGTLRGVKVPPSAWDDTSRASYRDRNWKRFRKTRWKESGV